MKYILLTLLVGMFLISFASAERIMPLSISETEFNELKSNSKSCVYPEEYYILDANKKVKGDQFENKIDLLCILVNAKADKIKLDLLEQKVTTLEQKVAHLENIIYNTKGTQIITDTKGEVKSWWEFFKIW